MQKLLNALVAVLSFVSMMSGVATTLVHAQERPPAVSGHDESAQSDEAAPVVVRPGITENNVEVKDRPLIIEGDVRGSVHAVNSRVTLMPGATVEGNLTVEGGSLSVAPPAAGLISHFVPADASESHVSSNRRKMGDWFGGQFCLWLLGLAGGAIVLLAAPHATGRVTETVSMRPGRSLLVGIAAAAGMFSALAVSGLIMHTNPFLRIVWMPATIVIALLSLVLLVFGWLVGMRRIGDLLARRFGQTGVGTFYGRMMYGLTAFFVINVLLGAVHLGGVGLFVEFVVALMGIGAVVQTGFGRDDPWPGRPFHGSPDPGLR